MKLFAVLTLVSSLAAGQTKGEGLPWLYPPWPPRVLAESDGIKVVLSVRPDSPAMQVVRHFCTVSITYPDGTEKSSPTFRIGDPDRSFFAEIHPRGHIALLVGNGLLIYSKENDKFTRIEILRHDLLEKKLQIDAFSVSDITWSDDLLVCAGMFRDKSKSSSYDFPFISRMKVDEEGIPSNHQILWTTWHPEATPGQIPDAWLHYAGKALRDSLLLKDGAVLWRNEGHWRIDAFPDSDRVFLKNSRWLETDLATGQTSEFRDISEAERLALASKETQLLEKFRKSLRSPSYEDNEKRLEHLIESLQKKNSPAEAVENTRVPAASSRMQ